MTWPEAVFGSICMICAMITALALVFGDQIRQDKQKDQDQ